MRATLAILALVVAAGCRDEECTPEIAEQKAAALLEKVQSIPDLAAATREAFQTRALELQQNMADSAHDPKALCQAVDELSALLDKG